MSVRYSIAILTFLTWLWAPMVLAGVIDSPMPANPCAPPIDDFKPTFVANESGTDFGGSACGSGGGCAETHIVCTHVGAVGEDPIDLAVELFSSSGLVIPGSFIDSNSVECGLLPGATVAFVTDGGIPPPYFGQPIVGGPQTPLGSLRIISTNPKQIACDVTLLDATNVGMMGTTTSTKSVTVTRSSKPQKGD